MGRTVPTMTQLVQSEEDLWAPFRRALRAEDRVAFDRLFAAARHYAAVASYAARPVPFEAILLSMLLEAMKAIQHLETEITALRAEPSAGRVDPLHGKPPALRPPV
ncbi:MAG TPA: hypothetical protein VGA35_08305 [bacterium]